MKKEFVKNLDSKGLIQRRLNIWVDEYPFELPKSDKIVFKKIVLENKGEELEDKKICIEFFMPRDHNNYALLGLQYECNNLQELDISISIRDTMEKFIKPIDCIDKDEKYKGILSDYIEPIFEEAMSTLKSLGNPFSGKISFNIAAYCNVGSGIKSFQIATRVLLNLLAINSYDDEKILDIFEKER